jgi:cytochrome b6-f complex iron-sulfur subunit
METTTALLIAIPVLVVLAGVLLFATARRRDTGKAIGVLSRETRARDRGAIAAEEEAAPTGREIERAAVVARHEAGTTLVEARPAPPVAWVPPDPDTLSVTRRQFMNRTIVTLFSVGLAAFGAACLAFLWPKIGKGSFGSKVRLRISDIEAKIDDGQGFGYFPEGRMWITRYPSGGLENARSVYPPPVLAAMEAGFAVLYQKCPHLGCRVPQCVPSQWFECPCHGSQYNQAGEKKGGPAPRGMDRWTTSVEGDFIVVDTSIPAFQGPPIGTNTTGQEAEGPHCITGGGGH